MTRLAKFFLGSTGLSLLAATAIFAGEDEIGLHHLVRPAVGVLL